MYISHLSGDETGLDYFGARYFSGAQGRFTSPDWSDTPQPVPYADFSDPQTLNLYAYARNNPVTLTDPDGHCPWCIVGGALLGGGSSYISQRIANKPINWIAVAGGALGGAVSGATLGMVAAPTAFTSAVSGITTVTEASVALKLTGAGVSGIVGGIASRTIESGGDPNKSIGNPAELATDFAGATAGQGAGMALAPGIKALSTAGKVVTLNEGKVAAGVRTPASYELRHGQLKTQQAVTGAVAGGLIDVVVKVKQSDSQRRRLEEEERKRQHAP